jgi:hypothetical protein
MSRGAIELDDCHGGVGGFDGGSVRCASEL